MNSDKIFNNLEKLRLSDRTERIFEILKNELLASERNNRYENIISCVKHIGKLFPYKIIINNTYRLAFMNTIIFVFIFWHFKNIYGEYIKQKIQIPKELINPSSFLELFTLIVLFGFIPILILINLIASKLSELKSSEEILLNIERQNDSLLLNETIKIGAGNVFHDQANACANQIDYFILDSLKAHFEYLLKREEKQKDRANAFIPIIAAIVILITYYVIGIPKEITMALNRSSEYESNAVLAGFLIIIYGAIVQFSQALQNLV